jgi:hypothetical protein
VTAAVTAVPEDRGMGRPAHRTACLRAPRSRPRLAFGRGPARDELHLTVPDELLQLIALGDRVPACAASGYWDLVEDQLAAWVYGQLPAGARDVSVVWNEELWEVVISWRRPRRTG